jgi:hypothetical protein
LNLLHLGVVGASARGLIMRDGPACTDIFSVARKTQ